jgi:hypothetical protein
MIPREAIEKAIEGGWKESMEVDKVVVTPPPFFGNPDFTQIGIVVLHHADQYWIISLAEVALDPAFWRALGKALGWEDDEQGVFRAAYSLYMWHFHARTFCDTILTGGDTKKFWDDILN